jgi:hypothetical protein
MVPAPGGGLIPGNTDIFLLPTDGTAAARHVQHFDVDAIPAVFAPDGGYAIVEEGRFFSQHPVLHGFNALDPGQNFRLNAVSPDEGFDQYLFVVAP